MAVIRAKRLFSAYIDPGTLLDEIEDLPAPQPTLPPQARASLVYTVPAGKRAIIRSMTFALDRLPAAGQYPSMACWLTPAGSIEHCVFWFWFYQRIEGAGYVLPYGWWNGQLVLHAGDQISVNHGAIGMYLHAVGSGHELNEMT